MTRAREEAVAAFKQRIGYRFRNEDLLERALTHASGTRKRGVGNNERLEFLGDRVLGLAIAHILYERHDTVPEGELSRMLSSLVRRDVCLSRLRRRWTSRRRSSWPGAARSAPL
jgi:ribonuclease-3